jgi:plastocyanin
MYERPRLSRAAAVLLAVSTLACSGGGGGGTTPPPPPTTGTIAGSVTLNGAGVAGATVAVTGGASANTSAGGAYSIANVSPGAKTVTVTPPANHALADGETAAKSATVVAGQTATVNWALKATGGGGVTQIDLGTAAFSPDAVTVPVGATVRWRNATATSHTITPNTPGQAGAWTGQNIAGINTTFEHTFGVAGVYDYHCTLHAGMIGRVTVN